MVTAKEAEMFSAGESPDSDLFQLPNLGPMAVAPIDQNYSLPYFNPSTPTANVAFQEVPDLFKLSHPFENFLHPTENPCLKNSKFSSDNPVCSPQEKKFIIFDRSGNHTRLFFSPPIPSQNQFADPGVEKVGDQFLKNPAVEEHWDENDLDDGEGELLENSEEIDALLYSDSDDDDDEVTSTRHIPFIAEDGLRKRQRLLDGGYKKSSWMSFESPINPLNYKGDDESSYVRSRSFYDGIDSCEMDNKVRIQATLKILGSIIPGSKGEDPVSVIENAIAYLESMKTEAEAMEPGSKSGNFSGSFGPGLAE